MPSIQTRSLTPFLLFVGCFSPTDSDATATDTSTSVISTSGTAIPGEFSATGSTAAEITTTNTWGPTTSITISPTTSTTSSTTEWGSTTGATLLVTSSPEATSQETTSTSSGLQLDIPSNLCGNCIIDPDEDCDYCELGEDIPKFSNTGLTCTNTCKFSIENPRILAVYCPNNTNFCGGPGCDQCEADMACEILYFRKALEDGFNPDTLSVKAINSKLEYLQYLKIGDIVFSNYGGGPVEFLPYPGTNKVENVFVTNQGIFGSGNYIYNFTCVVSD